MDLGNLEIILIYTISLSILFALSIILRGKFWHRFGALVFPILLGGVIIFNLLSFPAVNQPYFNWAYQGRLQRLPSNQLIDLFKTSQTPLRADWIYPFIADYYPGRTLLIPENLLDSLELSLDQLDSQGQLAAVEVIEFNGVLEESQAEIIQEWEMAVVPTRELDSDGNITREEGDSYHFFREEEDTEAALLLLRYDDQLFFIPEDLLPAAEEDL